MQRIQEQGQKVDAMQVLLEQFFQIQVNLQCWVKVKEDWRNRDGLIRNFGLNNLDK